MILKLIKYAWPLSSLTTRNFADSKSNLNRQYILGAFSYLLFTRKKKDGNVNIFSVSLLALQTISIR